MARERRVDLASRAQSPAETFSIRTQNRNFSTHALRSEEADLFEEQFNILINDFDSRHLTELYQQREDQISDTAGLAKNQFDEKLFGGINAADNEIGFDVLRPGQIRTDPMTGEIVNTWKFKASPADDTHDDYDEDADAFVDAEEGGWVDWIGDGSSDGDYTIDEDQVVVIIGYMDHSDESAISAINVDRFGRNVDMIPKDLNDARTFDNENKLAIQALPSLVGTERDRVHIRFRVEEPGTYEPRLIGFAFGVGSYMNEEDY